MEKLADLVVVALTVLLVDQELLDKVIAAVIKIMGVVAVTLMALAAAVPVQLVPIQVVEQVVREALAKLRQLPELLFITQAVVVVVLMVVFQKMAVMAAQEL